MAAAYISPAAEGAKPSAAQPRHSGVRKTLENLIHLIFLLCGVVAVAFVLLISIYLILSGIPAIREIGLGKFLFGKVWDPTNTTTAHSTASSPSFLRASTARRALSSSAFQWDF